MEVSSTTRAVFYYHLREQQMFLTQELPPLSHLPPLTHPLIVLIQLVDGGLHPHKDVKEAKQVL
jgi:hypothetical protein